MRKVILNTETNVTALDNVNVNKYYGIETNSNGRGFITAQQYCGKYICVSRSGLTYCNGWHDFTGSDIKEVIKQQIIEHKFVVYEFDTYKELFRWLAE